VRLHVTGSNANAKRIHTRVDELIDNAEVFNIGVTVTINFRVSVAVSVEIIDVAFNFRVSIAIIDIAFIFRVSIAISVEIIDVNAYCK
jgi:hypothetical protein